jgi:hypothetical protein
MKPYIRGNKFSPFISFADAVVVWSGVLPNEFPFVFLNYDYLPMHLDSRDLHNKAKSLLIFIESKCFKGITHTENGKLLPYQQIQLERDSFNEWRYNRASI